MHILKFALTHHANGGEPPTPSSCRRCVGFPQNPAKSVARHAECNSIRNRAQVDGVPGNSGGINPQFVSAVANDATTNGCDNHGPGATQPPMGETLNWAQRRDIGDISIVLRVALNHRDNANREPVGERDR